MPLISLLTRAAKPQVKPQTSSDDLGVLAAWQNAMFSNWPGFDEFPWRYATAEEALGLPVIGGFLNLLNSLLLQMPILAYRSNERIPEPEFLLNPTPGPGRTLGEFTCEYIHEMFLHGNYLAVLGPADDNGNPMVIYPVPHGQYEVVPTGPNLDQYAFRIGSRIYNRNQVMHVRINCRNGAVLGQGILGLFPRLISTAVAAENWSALYYEGGAVPPAHIESNQTSLTQGQADELKAKWADATTKRKAIVTPQGTIVHVFNSGSAEEAQLAEIRRFNQQALCMAIGVPPALLGLDAPSLTYRNITDVFQQFFTTTVMHYLVPLEQKLSQQCLQPGTRARFFTQAVLRPDMSERVDIAVRALQANLFDRDEARRMFNLTPLNEVV